MRREGDIRNILVGAISLRGVECQNKTPGTTHTQGRKGLDSGCLAAAKLQIYRRAVLGRCGGGGQDPIQGCSVR